MNYRNIKIPFLNISIIHGKAETFRLDYWDNSIPIDIERIIDLKLRLNIIPVHDLHDNCDTDALITSDWGSIYVDNKKYLEDRYQNRLRFSLAHEIGHFILHKDIYNSFKIKTRKDLYNLIKQIPELQYGYLEKQANIFANFLSIPRKKLIKEKQNILKNPEIIKKLPLNEISRESLNSYLSIPLSQKFMVSEDAVEIALKSIDDLNINE